jgi:hypothetical protein
MDIRHKINISIFSQRTCCSLLLPTHSLISELLMRVELTTLAPQRHALPQFVDPGKASNNSFLELLMRIELTTSSLPRKCSTTELQQPFFKLLVLSCWLLATNNFILTTNNFTQSGKRGSNSRPIAWKAIALPTELLPLVDFKFLIYDSEIRSTDLQF